MGDAADYLNDAALSTIAAHEAGDCGPGCPVCECLPLWECGDCFTEKRSHVCAHDDTGGTVTVYGPRCPECGCPMDFVEDPAEDPADEAEGRP